MSLLPLPWVKHRHRILIVVITREDVLRFVACDILFSWLVLAGLKKLELPAYIPFAASFVAPVLLKKAVDRL
ncbi:hypothetical protein [Cohnella sp. AR92]|uniref:hypothetical protein n=1 Tax=Cohnella sp. AR92 TaxID=648716 RepID=UPI000F8C8516|nr:hypothetical protein [Cohnella sp. AR92]RUS45016.1 hypothetical protein ELR57_20975 [Cohnella sp. AR92]